VASAPPETRPVAFYWASKLADGAEARRYLEAEPPTVPHTPGFGYRLFGRLLSVATVSGRCRSRWRQDAACIDTAISGQVASGWGAR
jgi:hypothetical protein